MTMAVSMDDAWGLSIYDGSPISPVAPPPPAVPPVPALSRSRRGSTSGGGGTGRSRHHSSPRRRPSRASTCGSATGSLGRWSGARSSRVRARGGSRAVRRRVGAPAGGKRGEHRAPEPTSAQPRARRIEPWARGRRRRVGNAPSAEIKYHSDKGRRDAPQAPVPRLQLRVTRREVGGGSA